MEKMNFADKELVQSLRILSSPTKFSFLWTIEMINASFFPLFVLICFESHSALFSKNVAECVVIAHHPHSYFLQPENYYKPYHFDYTAFTDTTTYDH